MNIPHSRNWNSVIMETSVPEHENRVIWHSGFTSGNGLMSSPDPHCGAFAGLT